MIGCWGLGVGLLSQNYSIGTYNFTYLPLFAPHQSNLENNH